MTAKNHSTQPKPGIQNHFKIRKPRGKSLPVIASIPHSGLTIPDEIAERLFPHHTQFPKHTDWHVDRLYDFLNSLGITVLQADFSRYVVDLNRPPVEPLFGPFQTSPVFSATSDGDPLYPHPLDEVEVSQRMGQFYEPYHQTLQSLLNEYQEKFDRVYLLDLHSFQSHYLEADVCLGNRNNMTCSPALIDQLDQCFQDQGFNSVQNQMFIGGHITQYYGQLPGVECVQIELRRGIYLKQAELDSQQIPNHDVPMFRETQERLTGVLSNFIQTL